MRRLRARLARSSANFYARVHPDKQFLFFFAHQDPYRTKLAAIGVCRDRFLHFSQMSVAIEYRRAKFSVIASSDFNKSRARAALRRRSQQRRITARHLRHTSPCACFPAEQRIYIRLIRLRMDAQYRSIRDVSVALRPVEV